MTDTRLDFRPSFLIGRKQFEVPWQDAEHVRSRLAQHGIPATYVLDRTDRKAAIEVDAHVGADTVLAVLT